MTQAEIYARAKVKAAIDGRSIPTESDCWGFDKKLHGIVILPNDRGTVTLHDDDAGRIYIAWTRRDTPKVEVNCSSLALAFARAEDAGIPLEALGPLGNQPQVIALEP